MVAAAASFIVLSCARRLFQQHSAYQETTEADADPLPWLQLLSPCLPERCLLQVACRQS